MEVFIPCKCKTIYYIEPIKKPALGKFHNFVQAEFT